LKPYACLVVSLFLVGCAAPTVRPRPALDATTTEFLSVVRSIDVYEAELRKDLSPADQPFVDLTKLDLKATTGPVDTDRIPPDLKAAGQAVFDRLVAARDPKLPVLTLEFHKSQALSFDNRGNRMIVTAGALVPLVSGDEFAQLMAMEIAAVDGGINDLRYRVPLQGVRIQRRLEAASPQKDHPLRPGFAALGAAAAFGKVAEQHEPYACSLLTKAGFTCQRGDSAKWMTILFQSQFTLGGSLPKLDFDQVKPKETLARPRDEAWLKASQGLLVGAALEDVVGSPLGLLNRRDGLRMDLTDMTGMVLGPAASLRLPDGVAVGVGAFAPSDFADLGFMGAPAGVGEITHLGQKATWSAHPAAGEMILIARWPLKERVYQFMLRGNVPVATLQQDFEDLLRRVKQAPMLEGETVPERRFAVATVANRAQARDLAAKSQRPAAFPGVSAQSIFLLLNGVSSFEELPDGPQVIRYLQ